MKVTQPCPTVCNPMDYTVPSPGDLPNPGIESRSPTLWANSLPVEPPGKPKNTGVGSLFLRQQIFLTQELNPGLPYCRWILYQLSHQGSPRILERGAYPFSSGSFPTQESNWDLLHCRWILYQLSCIKRCIKSSAEDLKKQKLKACSFAVLR